METALLKPKTPEDLQENILATYFWMRGGIIALAALLPVALVLYSVAAHGALTEDSISAYYGADNGVMRNDFVASLCRLRRATPGLRRRLARIQAMTPRKLSC